MTTLPSFNRRLTLALISFYAAGMILFRAPGPVPAPALETAEEEAMETPADILPSEELHQAPPIIEPAPVPAIVLPPSKTPVVLPRHAQRPTALARSAAGERPPVSGVVLAADKKDHFHDEFVEVTLRAEPAMRDVLLTSGPYAARVEKDGRPVTTVGQMEVIRLAYDAEQELYRGRWPVPWNAPDGEYRLRLAAGPWPDGLPAPETGGFKVLSRPFEPIPPGFAVLTLEGYRGLDRIPGPDGVKSIEGFPAWAQFIGADALFIQGGESSGFEAKPKSQFPWMTANFAKVRALGAECRRRGLKLGVYALCYMVGGPPELAADYEYGWNFDKSGLRAGLALEKRRGISIADPKRPGDIVDLLRRYQAMPEVDWLGLDYIRPAFGSCELVDDFVAEMPGVVTPPGYDQMTPEQRMLWLCRGRYSAPTPERRSEPRFILSDQWFWYRAHRTAEVVRSITQSLGESKPVWAFTLSWNKGWEHGQDPVMMRDAGLDMDGIMLYEADEPMFRGLVSHWAAYTRRDQLNLIVGNQVDWYLHQKTLNPSGPESYIDRILRAARNFHTDGKPVRGVFIHDIHRLLVNGKRKGPYKTMEWMMAAGHAITEVRRLNGGMPYDVALEVPAKIRPGEVAVATVSFRGAPPEGPVDVRLFSSHDLAISSSEFSLSAEAPSVPLKIQWTPDAASAQRGDRPFLAFRAARLDRRDEHPTALARSAAGERPTALARSAAGERPVIRTAYIQGHREEVPAAP